MITSTVHRIFYQFYKDNQIHDWTLKDTKKIVSVNTCTICAHNNVEYEINKEICHKILTYIMNLGNQYLN